MILHNEKEMKKMKQSEDLFEEYRKHIVGYQNGKYIGLNDIENVYADWCGTGKMYDEIEQEIIGKYGPFYSNLHSIGNPIVKFMENEYFKNMPQAVLQVCLQCLTPTRQPTAPKL